MRRRSRQRYQAIGDIGPPVAPDAPAVAENLAEAIRAQLGLPANIRPLPEPTTAASPGARAWARLIARIYEVDPLRCRRCGGSMRLIAFITEGAVIVRILDHLGEPSVRRGWRRSAAHPATAT